MYKEKRLRRPKSFTMQNSLRKHKLKTKRVCQEITESKYREFYTFYPDIKLSHPSVVPRERHVSLIFYKNLPQLAGFIVLSVTIRNSHIFTFSTASIQVIMI